MSTDTTVGSGSDDTLEGGDGSDLLIGQKGDDILDGGAGDDKLLAGSGNDLLIYDVAQNSGSVDDYSGGKDYDILQINVDAETADQLWFQTAMADYQAFLADPETQTNQKFDFSGYDPDGLLMQLEVSMVEELVVEVEAPPFNVIVGTNGNDNLVGTAMADDISALDGNDRIIGSAGNDIIDGGLGRDEVGYHIFHSDLSVDLLAGTASSADIGSDALISIEDVRSGNGDDNLIGDNNNNVFYAGGGNDTLIGNDGNDGLFGQDGDDYLDGGMGSDSLRGGAGNDVVIGGDGDDALIGDAGNDTMDGGLGRDTLSYNDVSGGVHVDLVAGTASSATFGNDMVSNFERIEASNFDDVLIGDSNTDSIFGQDGNDIIVSNYTGASIFGGSIFGQDGDDSLSVNNFGAIQITLSGGEGNDILSGSAGVERYFGGNGNDKINGSEGNDRIDGGAGTDELLYLSFSDDITVDLLSNTATSLLSSDFVFNIEDVATGSGNDMIIGDHNANMIHGQAGNDVLIGNDGNDSLQAGSGDDNLDGGNGSDTLRGGTGMDTITTGAGNDILQYSAGDGADIITDYMDGSDKFDLGSFGTNFASLVITDDGFGNAVIDMGGGDTMTLTGVNSAVLDASDFFF